MADVTRRGELRIYLGMAPGVGKTFAMLGEARRRKERGTDVVVGFVETHGRAKTAELIDGLEVVARRPVGGHPGLDEMDLDAVLARHPEVVLVDELAHTNAAGSRHGKRWQDVEDLLDAGIDVLTTVNVQHLESLNDVIERITGVRQKETVPDEVVRRAEQIELVDITPEALRRRLAHGNVYAAEKVDAALANYFQPGNLTALRELALLWVADEVDMALQRYRTEKNVTDTWETRERVVVALTGGKESETVLRRAARIAKRSNSADLLAVHVLRGDGLAGGARRGDTEAAAARRGRRRELPHRRRRRGRARRAPGVRPRGQRHAAGGRHVAALAAGPDVRRGRRRPRGAALRNDRRAHGHPRRGRSRAAAARAAHQPLGGPASAGLGARRWHCR